MSPVLFLGSLFVKGGGGTVEGLNKWLPLAQSKKRTAYAVLSVAAR
jgi:hypothetical protein